ncbi:hypothetical protein [Pseudoalteromonas piscicida]|uniref:hypothetical protein n=1 Tax=Pseudoalteromonas piscicida TaxID=43662 RepID=UPI0030AE16CC
MITYQSHSAVKPTSTATEQYDVASANQTTTSSSEQDYVAAASIAQSDTPVLENKVDEPYKYQVVERNQTFLEKMREAVMFSRLGANKEQIDELKEKMAELEKLAEQGKISPKELEARMAALEKAMEEAITQEENKASQDTVIG